jgi:hypothetical protein
MSNWGVFRVQQTCGNCGKPVGGSDITCPHCDALLAAYASPVGSSSTTTWEASAPLADAIPPVTMDEPAPAAKIDIPDGVETGSSAPRPLFDTNVTIEELREAAEDDRDETLVVVHEEDAPSKPVVFDGPDYARPPSNAEPVPVVENADAGLIARLADKPEGTNTPVPQTSAAKGPGAPVGQTAPVDTHGVTSAGPRREARPVHEVADTESNDRGHTEAYLRKLHTQAGYDSAQPALSRPVTSQRARQAIDTSPALATIEKSRKGCSVITGFVLFFLWLAVVSGILTGGVSPRLVFVAVAFTVLSRFLGKPLNLTGKR